MVIVRFRGDDALGHALEAAREILATKPGYVAGEVGRNVDEPDLWALTTRWADVGSYRRALSSYDVKLHVVPVLGNAIDEPTAYELLGDAPLNEASARELG